MSNYEWHMDQSYGARMQQRAIARDALCKKIVDMAIAYHDAPANSKPFALNDLEKVGRIRFPIQAQSLRLRCPYRRHNGLLQNSLA